LCLLLLLPRPLSIATAYRVLGIMGITDITYRPKVYNNIIIYINRQTVTVPQSCLVAARRHTYCTQGGRDGGVGVGVGGGCRFSLGARRRRRGRGSRREYRDRPEGRPPAVYTSSVFSAATAYAHDPCSARARPPFQTSTSVVVRATVASTTAAGKQENPK